MALRIHETNEVARIREELRSLLMAEKVEGAQPLLSRLLMIGANDDALLGEYLRWSIRFRLLDSMRGAGNQPS